MHREEADRLLTCLDCGAELVPGTDRDYEFGTTGVVCSACAERRGGRYDENRSSWVEIPDVRDLARAADDIDR